MCHWLELIREFCPYPEIIELYVDITLSYCNVIYRHSDDISLHHSATKLYKSAIKNCLIVFNSTIVGHCYYE